MAKHLITLIFICCIALSLSTDDKDKRATITNNNMGGAPGTIKINNNDLNGATSITNNNFGTTGSIINNNGANFASTVINRKPLNQAIVNNNAGGVVTNVFPSSIPSYVDAVKIISPPFPFPQLYVNKIGQIFFITFQNNVPYANFISARDYYTWLIVSGNRPGTSIINNNNGASSSGFVVNNNGGSSSGVIVNNNDAFGSFSITNNNVGGSGFSITNNNI